MPTQDELTDAPEIDDIPAIDVNCEPKETDDVPIITCDADKTVGGIVAVVPPRDKEDVPSTVTDDVRAETGTEPFVIPPPLMLEDHIAEPALEE